MTTLDIVKTLNEVDISKLSGEYKNIFIKKIAEKFNDSQKQLFVMSFYNYLNYNKNDFLIDIDNVWKWIGFSRKDKAKNALINWFDEDVDYIINFASPQEGGKFDHGGSNKETIQMSIKTFKLLCFKARTKKSEEIYEYYLTMENILHDIAEEQKIFLTDKVSTLEDQLLIKDSEKENLQISNSKCKEQEIHNLLLKTYKGKTLVYIMKVINEDSGDFIVKIGESRGNLYERSVAHADKYGDAIILACFESGQSKQLESLVLHDPRVSKCKAIIQGFETHKELVRISESFTLEMLIAIIESLRPQCENLTSQQLLELKKVNLIIQMREDGIEYDQIEKIMGSITNNSIGSNRNFGSDSGISSSSENEQEVIPFIPEKVEIKINKKDRKHTGPRVQKYDPITFELIQTYESVLECVRTTQTKNASLRRAVSENNEYKGFRWNFVQRNHDVMIPATLAPTQKEFFVNVGYIAKLNNDLTEIIEVYKNQKEAAEANKVCKATICKSVKETKIIYGYIYQLLENCTEDLRDHYISEHGIPVFGEKYHIEKICIERREVIARYRNMAEATTECRISYKSLHKSLDNNTEHKGFIYRKVDLK